MTDYCLLEREGIDELRNKSFLDLLRGKDGKAIAADSEHALMCLAACLGLIPPGCDNWKDVLYCRDPVTNMLYDMLKRMEQAGLLKRDSEKDWYLPIDLKTARFVDMHCQGALTGEATQRVYELMDKKLLWEDDLHQSVNDAGLYHIEDSPEPGKRWKFATVLYWSKEYPK